MFDITIICKKYFLKLVQFQICPWSAELRELRAERYTAIGDVDAAINDIKTTTKLDTDNTAGYYKLASLYYSMGEAGDSLRHIRECLKLDPEHKDCFPHYKKVKKVDKLVNEMNSAAQEKNYDNCIEASKKVFLESFGDLKEKIITIT